MALARPEQPPPQASWWGWGDPERVPTLPAGVRQLLVESLGVREPVPVERSLIDFILPASRLDSDADAELVSALGAENVLIDDEVRLRHTRGKSTPDLLRMRVCDADDAPDLVLLPGSHAEVLEVLRICSYRRIAVVPFGGGTSVVGGLQPRADDYSGVVAVDLRRMNALLELDEESRLAVLEPGLRGPEAEALLRARGYTLGHFPQSFEYATLGGFAAARSSGQASAGYGRFDELVVALRLATPRGTIDLGRAPKSAAGPDLRQLFLGSEGALGVITSLTVQVRPTPAVCVYEGWRLPSFREGTEAVRKLAQDGPVPTVLRLSDEAETALNLARPAAIGQSSQSAGCLAIVGFEGTADDVAARRAGAAEVLRAAGGTIDASAGETWAAQRYDGPYLRDALLDTGALVETLETATFWSSLDRLYQAVSTALRESLSALGTPPAILCHISHVYRAGASLYFTVGCAQLDDPLAQWYHAKEAASDAILSAGGSISHHHGVGTDHLRWFSQEIGELGMAVLRAAKAELDPAGILNPGILITDREPPLSIG